MPSNEPTPIFHHAIAKDISATFKIYERDEGFNNARMVTFEHLQKLVKSIGDSEDYELIDTSFGSLQGLPDFCDAPLECMIVDKSRPEGLSPSHGAEPLPTPYDAIALSRFLSYNGYDGTFIESRPDVVGYDATNSSNLNGPALPQKEASWSSSHLSPAKPLSTLFPILSPILRIRPQQHSQIKHHPNITDQEYCESDVNVVKQVTNSASSLEGHTDSEIEIHLSPAHPSRPLRWNLLRTTVEKSPAFRTLMSIFWLWTRIQGMRELWRWETCAYVVMFYMQARHKLPNQASSDVTPQGFWNRLDVGPEPIYERIDAPSFKIPNLTEPTSEIGPLIYGFFSYLTSIRYLPYNQVFFPFTGSHVTRKRKYRANGKDLDEASVLNFLKAQAEMNVKDALWDYQPLVLLDPFLPHHNVAHSVTKHALHILFHKAKQAALTIKSGQPIMEIFGTEVGEEVPLFNQKDDGVESQQRIYQSTLGGRRLYHSSATFTTPRPLKEQSAFPIAQVSNSILSARSRTIQRVRTAIRKRYGSAYKVECFGSTQYGVDSPTSDLDLVVLDQQRMNGFTPEVNIDDLPIVYNMRNVARTLERSGFKIIQVIPFATVPIVKFEDPLSHISCDININEQLGLFNTQLIASYCSLSPVLRPLLLLVKKWAKSLGLNDPSGVKGTWTFSSYALTLMTIGFLQELGQLPNLQAKLAPLSAGEGFWLKAKNGERIRCDARFNRTSSWTPPDGVTKFGLDQALYSWFHYWGHHFNYAENVMSIRDGGVIPRTERAATMISSAKQGKKRAKTKKQDEKGKGKGKEFIQKIPATQAPSDSEESRRAIGEGSNASEENTDLANLSIEDPDKAALEEMSQTDIAHGKQPRTWSLSTLVVADPFIVSKNATGAITVRAIERFTAECRRSLALLNNDAPFEDLLGDGKPIGIPEAPRGRPRRNKGRAINVTPAARGRGREKNVAKVYERGGPRRTASMDKEKGLSIDLNETQAQGSRRDRSTKSTASSYKRHLASKSRDRNASKDRAKVRAEAQDENVPNLPRKKQVHPSRRRPSLSGKVEGREDEDDMAAPEKEERHPSRRRASLSKEREPKERSRSESRARSIAEPIPDSGTRSRQRSRGRVDTAVSSQRPGSNAKADNPRRQNQSYGKGQRGKWGPRKAKGPENNSGHGGDAQSESCRSSRSPQKPRSASTAPDAQPVEQRETVS